MICRSATSTRYLRNASKQEQTHFPGTTGLHHRGKIYTILPLVLVNSILRSNGEPVGSETELNRASDSRSRAAGTRRKSKQEYTTKKKARPILARTLFACLDAPGVISRSALQMVHLLVHSTPHAAPLRATHLISRISLVLALRQDVQ